MSSISVEDVETAVARIVGSPAAAVDAREAGDATISVAVDAGAVADADVSIAELEDAVNERAPAGTRIEVSSR